MRLQSPFCRKSRIIHIRKSYSCTPTTAKGQVLDPRSKFRIRHGVSHKGPNEPMETARCGRRLAISGRPAPTADGRSPAPREGRTRYRGAHRLYTATLIFFIA
ncbi:hypothetical protein EVAR_54404_1 [Eumeta japonica]|uniref:Uncharacterized protein n=1 Tax=Eumeta variegata TaxID=151549 RepID=A0A4C1Y420_EUMVA|nr:hypothetical protein EVAR_54404_1 [Eumeta japonica]